MWLVTKTEMIRPTYVHVQLLEGKSTLLTRDEYANQVVHVTPLEEGASLPTQVALSVNASTQEVNVLNTATGTVWGYDWEVNASYAVGYYSDAGEFTPLEGDIPCYAMAVGIKHYVKAFVDAHALFGRTRGNPDNLRAAYPTPLSQATAICRMAKLADDENDDQAMYSIAYYLDIPYQWCLDVTDGVSDPHFLTGYLSQQLCPTDEAVLAARQYLPVEYEGYMTTEAEDEEAWAAINDSWLRF